MQFGFEQCPYCGFQGGFVYVHGHYQCKRCHQNVMPCCSGEQGEVEQNHITTDNQESYNKANKAKTNLS
jgi:hypothetical protein